MLGLEPSFDLFVLNEFVAAVVAAAPLTQLVPLPAPAPSCAAPASAAASATERAWWFFTYQLPTSIPPAERPISVGSRTTKRTIICPPWSHSENFRNQLGRPFTIPSPYPSLLSTIVGSAASASTDTAHSSVTV